MSDFHLPSDVLRKILLRLPAVSLLHFRIVCKEWRRVIDDPVFVRARIDNQPYPNNLIIGNRTGAPIYSFSLDSLNFINGRQHIPAKPIKQLVHPDVPVTSCDGLILLCRYDAQKSWSISIWNPLTGNYGELPKPNVGRADIVGCGLGYDRTTDDYKVVRTDVFCRPQQGAVYYTRVYSLKMNSWKLIENCPCRNLYFSWPRAGVFLNGALHWLSWDTIVALDLGTEKYRHLPLPLPILPLRYVCLRAHFDALGGCLMLSYLKKNKSFDGWVMKNYGVQDSWMKLFSFEEQDILDVAKTLRPVAYLKDKSQVFLQYDGGFFWFDVERNSVKKVSVDGHPDISSSQICHGSLFRLNDGGSAAAKITGVKRKRKIKMGTMLTFHVRDIGSSSSSDSGRFQ